jgi:cytochrome b
VRDEAETGAPDAEPATEVVRLWDPLTRAFHWLLAALVLGSLVTGEFTSGIKDTHFQLGYVIAGLLAFRVVWGFKGPEPARFSDFVRGPGTVARYAATMPNRRPSYWRGHNPVGGWAVVVILALLAAQILTGMMSDPEDFLNRGPLAGFVGIDMARTANAWHVWLSGVVMLVVLLHVAAIAFYSYWKGENLVGPMLWGAKRVRKQEDDG